MPFGLYNAPTTFMHLMNDILHLFLDSFVILYLYDILVFRFTWKDHISYLISHVGVRDPKKTSTTRKP
jgi:hypothetical protein